MIIHEISFQIYRNIDNFPLPLHLETETQFSDSYRNTDGKFNGLVVYTFKGRGCFQEADGQVHELLPGIAYACAGAEPGIKYYYPSDAREPWTFMWFSFKGEYVESMLAAVIRRYGRTFQIAESHPVIQELIAWQQHDESVVAMTPHEGSQMVFAVINMLAGASEKNIKSGYYSRLAQKAQQLITADASNKITCAGVATALNISREHLSRIFRRETGISLNEFIIRRKIISACQLLKNTRMTCKEIADAVGYGNSANFIRVFKAYQYNTPRQFRKNGVMPIY